MNKGRGYIEIPAEHPLPDIIRKHEFRAKKIFWQEVTELAPEELKAVAGKLAGSMPSLAKLEQANGGSGKWHRMIIRGSDVRRRAGFRKWILELLVPPLWDFDGGDRKVAVLKSSNDARTFRLFGQIPPHGKKDTMTWEEYVAEKEKLRPQPWDKETHKAFKKQYSEYYGKPPWHFLGLWIPEYLSPSELRTLDGIQLGVMATVNQAAKNASEAARAKVLEGTVQVQEQKLRKYEDHMMDQNVKLGDATARNQALETELNLTQTPGLIHAEPTPVAFAAPKLLGTTAEAKKKPEPGWFLSILWIIVLVLGIGMIGAGSPWGVLPLLFAGMMLYLNYGRQKEKIDLEKISKTSVVGAGQSLGDAAEKVKELGGQTS